MARQLGTVALLDMKMETGDLAALLDLKPTYSLADLSKNVDRLDEVLLRRTLVEHPSGVHLLSSPKSLNDVDLVTPEGIRQSIRVARASFPSVVVDLDHHFGEDQLETLRHAEVILIVLRLDFTSLKNTAKFLNHLDGLGVPMDRVRVVASRTGQPKEVPIAKVEEALKFKVFLTVPDEPKVVNRANNNGIPVVLDAPSSKVSKALLKLAQSIQAIGASAAAKEPAKPEVGPRPTSPVAAQRVDAPRPTVPTPEARPSPAASLAKVAGNWRS